MAKPSDRFGVDGPPRQLLECSFATFEGIVDPDMTYLSASTAGKRASKSEQVVRREFAFATRGTCAIGTRNRQFCRCRLQRTVIAVPCRGFDGRRTPQNFFNVTNPGLYGPG